MLLHESFESHAARRPYAVALTVGDRHLTYGELNGLANQFAHALIRAGVTAERCVGLHLPPSAELIAAMLGIMKAGGAYVPLDPDLPANRVAQILELARPGVIISQRATAADLPGHSAQLMFADRAAARSTRVDDPRIPVGSDDLCYVMFTSGSMGAPKGVMVTHGNLVPLFDDIGSRLDLEASDVWTAYHPFSFGFSVWEIWGALRHGGRLVIVPPEWRTDPERLFDLVRTQQVTMVSQTPSAFRQNLLSDAFADGLGRSAIRCVVLSGEALDARSLQHWFAQHGDGAVHIVNTYAITETAGQLTFADITSADCEAGTSATAGRPLAHAELAIVDENGELVSPGQAGELWVGGPGVARGYLGLAEQTREQFVTRAIDGYLASRWYRTGDRARLTSGGELEFLGRADAQVKLRGYRIELGEIASVLRAHPQIDDAAVELRADDGGEPRLVGYVVPKTHGKSGQPSTHPEFWPSVGPYQLYDEFLYDLMSSEAERLASYRSAFDRSVRDKVVLDIGTGEHALLARLCVDAGARKVYAVEVLEEAYRKAHAFVNAQGLDDRIVVMHGDMATLELPEPVDVCTQGIIGNIGSADGIVSIWNSARRHFSPDCVPVPARCRTLIAAVELPPDLAARPAFSPMAQRYAEQAFDKFGRRFDIRLCVSDFPETAIISDAHIFEDLDFTGELVDATQGGASLTIERGARLDGYLVWTVVTTGGDADVDYRRTQRAWLPVFFPLGETGERFGVPVRASEVIDVAWSVSVSSAPASTGQPAIHPDYRVVTTIAPDGGASASAVFEYVSRYDEMALNSTPLHRALWCDDADTRTGVTAEHCHDWLAQRLPDYMVPAAWVELERLPLTGNQKLDRQALPAPERRLSSVIEPARDDLERDLAMIWQDMLNIEHVGIHDNFFDLGGDSISAVRTTSALQRLLDDAVMLVALFDAPTVAGLGQYLRANHAAAIAARYSGSAKDTGQSDGLAIHDGDDAPLSFQQQSFWVLNRLYPTMTGSNEQFVIPLDGAVDADRLELAWNGVLECHEILRSVFRETDSGVRQVVLPHDPVSLPVVALIGSSEEVDEQFFAAAQASIGVSYALADGPLIHARLFHLSNRSARLLVNAHHIIADGLSIRIIRDELAERYARTWAPSSPTPQYRDYAIRQRAESHDAGWQQSLDYWRSTLQDAPQRTALPSRTIETVAADEQWRGHQRRIGFTIDAATADGARTLSRQSNATLFMTLLAAFRVLLVRYAGQSDIVIGSPVTAREGGATCEMVGCLVNNVVFRNPVGDGASFAEVLRQERATALAALQHAGVPFEQVVEALHPRRRFGEHPLFQILFLYEDAFARTQQGGDVRFGLETLNTSRSSYWDIEFSVSDSGDGGEIRGYVGYSTARFDDTFIEALPAHYEQLLRGVVVDPQTRIDRYALLEPTQRHAILVDWNATGGETAESRKLHTDFAAQVERSPDAIALIADDLSLSYRELAGRVNQLAVQLRDRGVGPGDLVGIGLGRSVELVVGILATLSTGAAYVPLDPNYPVLRLQFIVAQTGLRMILADEHLPRSVSGTLDTIRLDRMEWASDPAAANQPVERSVAHNTPAYVLYTSGSTGAPKGAIGLHAGAVNRCAWMWQAYGFTSDDVFCLRTSPNFVDSVWEIFGPLMHGATLRILADADVTDPLRLVEQLAAPVGGKSISHLVVVPSLLTALLDIDARLGSRLPGLRSWITSGEPLHPELLRRFRRACPGVTLLNTYGSSENWDATCFNTDEWREDESIVPIGKPIAGVRTHVLDVSMQPVPVGVVGELYVGGIGLGAGYLQQPELNARQFVADPFSSEPSAKLYRTGDLARYRADGNIECLGRADRQIKLRGFRIEPDEVAAAMRDHPAVADACVIVRAQPDGESGLVGYFQPGEMSLAEQEACSSAVLRSFLKTRLPDFMLPGVLHRIDRMPLTPSGKIDFQALPDPDSEQLNDSGRSAPFIAPGTETERAVAQLWCEILGTDRVSLHDDFFDRGGHSLSATRLLAQIRARFDISPDLAQFFDAPTLVSVARHIDEQRAQADPAAVAVSGSTALGDFKRGERPPLSFAQERLWFLNELDPDSLAYNIAFTIHLSGSLDLEALQSAINHLVQRHESLRTRFLSLDGRPYQQILSEQSVPITSEDFGDRDPREWEQRLRELSAHSFSLHHGPLLRLHVLHGDPQKALLLVVIHHMVSDGLSNGIFFDELATLYDCMANDREAALPVLPIQYADFSIWQRHGIERHELDAQLEYWLEQLRDAPPALELPTDRPRPAEQMFRGAWLWRELSAERAETLRVFGRQHRCTLFMVLLGAFDVLLSRYSGQTDVVVGSPIAGRAWAELDGMIGLFVNTVALRTDLSDDPTFSELLARVRRTTLDSQANQDLPFERLVESLRPDRTLSHAPVFQVMFNMTPIPDRTRYGAGVRMRMGRLQDHGVSTFDLTLNIGERENGLDLVFEYDRDLFDRQTIERIATHFDYLLKVIVDSADGPISELPLWPVAEHAVLLARLNPAPVESVGSTPSVVECFEAWAGRQPDAIAVTCDEHRLTYGELERLANALATRLQAMGIEPGQMVAICLDRSVDLLVGVLGVLKSGCAYVPLDPAYPAARLTDLCAVVQPAALIAGGTSELSLTSGPVIRIGDDAAHRRSDAGRLDIRLQSADRAYALFTSGSTGTPKAVAVTHGNLAAIFSAWRDAYELTPSDRHLQMASFSFDVFAGDWVRALCSGGRLDLCPRFDLLEPERLYGLLRDRSVTCAEFVPAVLRGLLTYLESSGQDLSFMRLIVVGSEAWYGTELARLVALAGPHTRVINSYGTAETTIDSTFFESGDTVSDDGPVPIGRPFAGSRVYVCDPALRLVPPGVAGELCIGGAGVSAGYVCNPELTAEKFVSDPFSSSPLNPGGRLYRTGDRARYRSDGSLVLLGRMDRQIKLRGFRIEPGEVEAALVRQPAIAAAAVIAESQGNERRLIAYVVSVSEPIDMEALRADLRSTLPDYMVPSSFIELDTLPVTANGKLDRRRLPTPEAQLPRAATRAVPVGPIAAALLELYQDVLGEPDIGLRDSFFDRGGHSLLATQLVSRIRDVLNIELPLRALFENPTVGGLVRTIDRHVSAPPPVRPVRRSGTGAVPVSLMQRRLWFLAALEPGSSAYHLHWSVRLTGALDHVALSRAIDALVARHESLRTTFTATDPHQSIARYGSVKIQSHEASVCLEDLIALPFDLESGPLLRMHLVEHGPDRHDLLLVIHHIIADGWSMSVLFAELSEAYNAYRCGESPRWALPDAPGLPVQYADFALWQRDWLAGAELSRQVDFWRDRLADAPAILELPIDRPRSAQQGRAGAWHRMMLPTELTASIHDIGRGENCTLFMVLLAAFDVVLARSSGMTDIVVGTPIAGRNRTELEGLIGFFVNTLVLRTSVGGNPTFQDLLMRVKQTALDAYAHQDLPFEKLVEVLQPQRQRSVNPIVQVMFTVHNQPVQPFAPDGLTVESIETRNDAAKFDLSVHVAERDDELEIGFGYDADLFDLDTVEAFANAFESILTDATADVSVRVSELGEVSTGAAAADWSGTLVERFAAQVRRAPGAIAVQTGDAAMSYGGLNKRANGVAQQLLSPSLSLRADPHPPRIGLLCDYDERLVSGLFGILKAGCAWVPLDPTWPESRLAGIAADAGLAAVVTDQKHLPKARRLSTSLLPLIDLDEEREAADPVVGVSADGLACIIYTSGSSGAPKGVVQTQGGIVIQVGRYSEALHLGPGDQLSGLSGYAYDAAIQDIFGALLNGATLVPSPALGSDGKLVEPATLIEQLVAGEITVLHLTPTLFRYLLQNPGNETCPLPSARVVALGGETARRTDYELFRSRFARGAKFINGLGLTESTVALQFVADHDTRLQGQGVPVGTAVSGLHVDLIDASGASSWLGEIVLTGTGFSPGYWCQQGLDRRPFHPVKTLRTGDIGRRLFNGQIIFTGRRDDQVNVRGYRIEPGEIQAHLGGLPGVADSAVRVWQQDDDVSLAAYVVMEPGVEMRPDTLHAALTARLPRHMVPQTFSLLDVLPRLPNGKLARHALPAPQQVFESALSSALPRTELEEILASIWCELLHIETLGVHDDFFALGGHSLLATRVIARIGDRLSREVMLASIFDAPTVAGLAALIESNQSCDAVPALTRVPRVERRRT